MRYVPLGSSGLVVSAAGLGCNNFGRSLDLDATRRVVDAAIEAGITLLDTADTYGGAGRSEEILGEVLAGRRDQVVLATKFGYQTADMGYGPAAGAKGGRGYIRRAVENSLRRLRTDYIDIYQVHWPDPRMPVEETADAMRALYQQGKIRAIGVSNFSVAQMEAFRRVAPLHVLQSPYNLFERAIEAEILPYCRANGIATLGYGALCRGLLSGRMRADTAFQGDDLRRIDPKFQPPRFAQYLEAVRRLDELARRGFHQRVIHLAVRWMLDQGISVALWGARRPDQLEAALGVAGWSLDEADRALIELIVNTAVADPVGPEFMAPLQRA
jgi:aryl-alcohol dehydrogenase-like predicted oxidoreductase